MYRKYNSEWMKNEAFKKMRSFCNYQPRAHKEVKDKLYSFGLWKRDVEEVLAQLIVEGYVNEGKFTDHYVDEKFEMNKWGRVKIKSHLNQRQISEYCMNAAIKRIKETEYKNNLYLFARKKWDSVKGIGCNHFVKLRKTGNYLLQKGYESHLVWDALRKLRSGEI